MKKYKVLRTFVRSQIQVVEAADGEQAIEIAENNQENFDNCINSDDEWEYKAEEL